MKHLKRLALALALCACSAPLYAADSASNRDSQFIRFGTKVLSVHGQYLLSAPTEIEFPGKNITIGFAGGSRSIKSVDNSSWSSSTGWSYTYKTVKASTAEVNIRYYPGNSFNWLLSYGKYKRDYKDWPSLSNTTYDVKVEATQVNFGLGNEWTFDFGLYIGADWLMVGSKLSDSYTATLKSGTETASSKSDIEDKTRWTAGGVAIFRIGVGF
ncbi:MAG: hypothetical protein VX610_02635 [SAR324 cluster bacterium]|nr:hypothetical protein [SAR324 cluster bacterium]